MQLITVYLQYILSEHPDEPKSLPYSHSVKAALTETTWRAAQTTLNRSWSSGPVPPQPHLCPAVGVSSSIIQHPKTPSVATVRAGKPGDWSLSLQAAQRASVRSLGLCSVFKISLFHSTAASVSIQLPVASQGGGTGTISSNISAQVCCRAVTSS